MYLAILSSLNWVLLVVIAATCVVGFLVSRYSSNWIFRHRDEEETFYAKKSYIRKKRNPWSWRRISGFSVCKTG